MALELTRAKPAPSTKTSINLAESNQAPRHLGRDLALFVLALVVIALFAKFGVIDVMGAASAASAKVTSAQAQLDDLEAGNADYSALQERYDSFAVNSLTAEESSLSDRKDVLALLENTVASTADSADRGHFGQRGGTGSSQTPRSTTCRAWWRRSKAIRWWRA